MASPEGVEFVTSANEAWYRAHVEGGEDEATARAMADRCLAAYTAQPEA